MSNGNLVPCVLFACFVFLVGMFCLTNSKANSRNMAMDSFCSQTYGEHFVADTWSDGGSSGTYEIVCKQNTNATIVHLSY